MTDEPNTTAPPKRRRGRLALVITVLVALVAVALVVADNVARGLVADTTAAQIRDVLKLDAAHPVDVTVAGWAVLPQLIANRLDRLDVTVDDVTLGELHGRVAATASGVPVSGTGSLDTATVDVSIDRASVEALATEISNETIESVELDPPVVHFATALRILGLSVDLGVGLEPSAADGDIAFAPADLTVGGASVTAEELRERFGGLVSGLLSTRTYCIAGDVPAGLKLSAVEVGTDALDATFDVDPRLLVDPALQESGECR
ncbi:DUF2993 domain-containing protein [Microbacteriaceae bacterium VKM Ac-2854]|nr:DUF2993 domain-containing protein [Microbacteriaceae bacterium VKM Ac-2854]